MIYPSLLRQKITFQGYVANGDITEFQNIAPINRPCMIQQDSETKATLDDSVNVYTYTCYLNDATGVQEGVKAVDGDGKEYQVRGVEPKPYGFTSHTKVALSD